MLLFSNLIILQLSPMEKLKDLPKDSVRIVCMHMKLCSQLFRARWRNAPDFEYYGAWSNPV